MILPVAYTKGLEFDAVLLFDPSREKYPSDDAHVKLLYVAATRALHELAVLYKDILTGLIADPVPEREQKIYQLARRHGVVEEYSHLRELPKNRIEHFGYVASQYTDPEVWESHLNGILRQYV